MSAPILGASRDRRLGRKEALGYPVYLFIVWLILEYCRPPNPMKIPYMISLTFLAGWLLGSRKLWNPQIIAALLFVAQMTMMIPFSENNYAARMVTREAFVIIVCIAIPVAHFITSLKQYGVILHSWVVVFLYMAVIALLNGGNGPGGAAHGVDENYTALFMTVAIANIYFLGTVARSRLLKLGLWAMVALCVAAIVIGFSRGGFVGLVMAAAYCWLRSPSKWRVLLVVALLSPIALALVPQEYWMEVNSIGDTSEATADRRIRFWLIATEMFLDHPVFGVGPGNFPWMSGFYENVDGEGTALGMNVTHSLYFELIAEMGTTGVILLCTMIFYNARDLRWIGRVCARQSSRLRATRRGRLSPRERAHLEKLRRARAWAGGLAGSFVGFFVCSAFLSTLYYTTFWLLTALTIALRESTRAELAALRPGRRQSVATRKRRDAPAVDEAELQPTSIAPVLGHSSR